MFHYAGVSIRPVEEADLPRLLELRADQDVWDKLGDVRMPDLDRQRAWYRGISGSERSRYYCLSSEKVDFLGMVRMDEIDIINRSLRVGGDILRRHQRQGYGTRMFRLIKKYGFDYLNAHRLWLLVIESNDAAIQLYRKTGFVEEGRQREAIFRNGRYLDYVMMSLLESQYQREES